MTRAEKTARIYLAALDSLIAHLEAQGMPTGARAVRCEHVESILAGWRSAQMLRRYGASLADERARAERLSVRRRAASPPTRRAGCPQRR